MGHSQPVINRIRTFLRASIGPFAGYWLAIDGCNQPRYLSFFACTRFICSSLLTNLPTRRSSVAGRFTDVR